MDAIAPGMPFPFIGICSMEIKWELGCCILRFRYLLCKLKPGEGAVESAVPVQVHILSHISNGFPDCQQPLGTSINHL
ncbi:hypothetical protein MKX01_032781 [Papaver californicum]|nr:hypothetical protein MKX01_032781 [Papaver californicum]